MPTLESATETTLETIYYLFDDPSHKTEKPYAVFLHGGDVPGTRHTNVSKEKWEQVPMTDIRGRQSEFKIDEVGFELVKHQTGLSYQDFNDDSIITDRYYKEIESLLKEKLGASRVLIFDHTLRQRYDVDGIVIGKREEPQLGAHIDQTPRSIKDRIARLLPEEAASLCAKRNQIINVWRPLFGPCQDSPLAFCDYRTLDLSRDLVATEYGHPGYVGESYNMLFNDSHRWYFISDQETDEVWIFKCGDTTSSSGIATMAGHTSFEYSGTPTNARPRESVELRVLVFYED